MARARRFVSRRSGRKADLRWIGGRQVISAITNTTSAVIIVSQGNTSQTIMRTRGSLLLYLNDPVAAGDVADVAVGFLVVPAGLSTTVTSSPITDPDAPWFYYDRVILGSEDTVAPDQLGLKVYRSVIDVKAMRVLRPDQEVQFVVETTNVGGTVAVNFAVAARFLIAD